jgi:tetratricopeptide (TPR) repeat protein
LFSEAKIFYGNPGNSNWHFRAAYNYNQWGRYEKAIEELKKSIKLTPHVLNPYEVMAMIYYEKLHQPRKAIEILETGLKNAPDSPIRDRVKKRLEEIGKAVSGG